MADNASQIDVYGVSEKQDKIMRKRAARRAEDLNTSSYEELAQELGFTAESMKSAEAIFDTMNILLEEYLPQVTSDLVKARVTAEAYEAIEKLKGTPGIGDTEVEKIKNYWLKHVDAKVAAMELTEAQRTILREKKAGRV